MDLGTRLRQARLEAGLSQRQLCGEVITRNMLSLIENGSAKPSMETLRYLASKLGKPMGYFLEEQAVTSPNRERISQARQAMAEGEYQAALVLLEDWQGEDPVFDPERYFLEALCCIRQAELALVERQPGYARELLDRAETAGSLTAYYTPELRRTRLLLLYRAQPDRAPSLEPQLPDWIFELMLRAQSALEAGDYSRCGRILDAAAPCDAPQWHLLRAEAYFGQQDYTNALPHYQIAEEAFPKKAVQRLEHCYRELEDYKMAYFYACKRREADI